MNIGLLSILHNKRWDFRPDLAQTYANALRNAIELQLDNDIEKQHGYFLSRKGYQKEGKVVGANFEDKLYVGNIHRIENHLYWNDEELADDDEIVNVVVVDGPVTRDGGGCSYGSKDWRDQVMYANTIPQVVGHLFIVNTPGGEAECRNDYDMMIADCREKGKPTVALIDGGCYSSGVNLTCRCDRVIVMNPKDGYGCIGTMAAFWTVAHDTVDQDGYRYVELVGKDCPEKNAWWREAAKGEYEKLQAELDKDTNEFHRTVRENRPLVTGDMLSGKVFEAQELIPALVDEIGDMERAIECVFQLADKTLTPAREATPIPSPDGEGGEGPKEPGNDPEGQTRKSNENTNNSHTNSNTEMANIKEQFPALFAALQVEEMQMTDEGTFMNAALMARLNDALAEKDAAQEQETDGQISGQEEKPAEEAPAVEEKPAEEEQSAEEEEKPAEEEQSTEEEEKPAEDIANAVEDESLAGDGASAGQPSEEAQKEAQADIDKITETLHSAEQMVAEKDKVIAELKESLAGLDGIAEERDAAVKERDEANTALNEKADKLTAAESKIAEHAATIETLKNQVEALKAEVKALSNAEKPMIDGSAGEAPVVNGTGSVPKVQKRITRDNMSYEHCREVAKERKAEREGAKKK